MFVMLLTGALGTGFALALFFRAIVLVPASGVQLIASVSVAAHLDYEPWYALLVQAETVTALDFRSGRMRNRRSDEENLKFDRWA